MDRYGNVGFSYEKKDRQGETRTTLEASGMLDVTIRDADRAVAEQLIASVNRDADSWQEVTRDERTKRSGDLNVRDLAAFSKNVKAIADYSRARSAAIPDGIAAQGPRAIDTWRKMIINGASVEEATAASGSDLFQSTVAMLQGCDDAVAA